MLQSTIHTWLNNAANSKKKAGNTAINNAVCFYYGLCDQHGLALGTTINKSKTGTDVVSIGSITPTLSHVGDLLGVSKERARQLLKQKIDIITNQYNKHKKASDNPFCALIRFIQQHDVLTTDALQIKAENDGWVSGPVLWPLVLRFLSMIEPELKCIITTTKLKSISMKHWHAYPYGMLFKITDKAPADSDSFGVDDVRQWLSPAAGEYCRSYDKLLSIAPRCGIIKVDSLDNEPLHGSCNLSWMLSHQENAWVAVIDDELWFVPMDRNNSLINMANKVLFYCEPTNVDRLSEALANALKGRSPSVKGIKFSYPTATIIKKFLSTSPLFNSYPSANGTMIAGVGNSVDITQAEQSLLDIFKRSSFDSPARRSFGFSELCDLMSEMPCFDEHTARKAINFSPFIWVDKSKGRRHHFYELVSPPSSAV